MWRLEQIGLFFLVLTVGVLTFGGLAVGAGAVPFDSVTGDKAVTVEAENVDESLALGDADAVYVSETGDAVLVYESPSLEERDGEGERASTDAVETDTGAFGLEADVGLWHLLYTVSAADDADDGLGLAGELAANRTADGISSEADLRLHSPDGLERVDVRTNVTQTQTTATSNTSLSLVTDTPEDELGLDIYPSLTGETETETTGTTFATTGSMAVDFDDEFLATEVGDSEIRLTQTDDAYQLEVREHRHVSGFERDDWDSEADAKETLEAAYQSRAQATGGTATVTLEDHTFENDTDDDRATVSLAYTVQIEGVTDQLADSLARELESDPDLDLGATEARAIADRLVQLHVEEVAISTEQTGTVVDTEWRVEIEDYDELVLGIVEIAESIDTVDDDIADEYDEIRAVLDAQAEAELVQTTTSSVAIATDQNQTSYDVTSSTETDNWEAYVSALEEHDVGAYAPETTLWLETDTVEDEMYVTYEYESTSTRTLEWVLTELEPIIERQLAVDDGVLLSLESVQQTTLERTTLTLDADGTSATVEAAGSFDGPNALHGVPLETDDATVTAVHGETDDGVTTLYVSLEGFVEENADEATVRSQQRVGEHTAVYLPGEWDREFPALDDEAVRSSLGYDSSSSLLAGLSTPVLAGTLVFAIVVTVVGGLLGYRRRTQ